MVEFDSIIGSIKDNNGFKPNQYGDSFYRYYNIAKGSIQVRISNHGTELWTWVKNATIDPSDSIANIVIVFSNDGSHRSVTNVDMNVYQKNIDGENVLGTDGKRIIIGRRKIFEVKQYVYNLSLLSTSDIAIINKKIKEISRLGFYYDPFQQHEIKHASVSYLMPNEPEKIIIAPTLNKDLVSQNIATNINGIICPATKYGKGADDVIESKLINNQNINENNMKSERKKVVRLTESDLHRVIKESVKKVLKENDDFKAHGYKTTSNLGGHEVEISPSGDAARFRFYGGEPTDWLEIEFDGNGVAYVETERGKQRLCDYMRY